VSVELDETVSEEEVIKHVQELNERADVHGILVQLPLPSHIDEQRVLTTIKVEKDVDGFLAENVGNLALKGGTPPKAIACTPAGVVELLQRSGIDPKGKTAVVVGRSNIVGMPMFHLLLSMDATVTVVHSRTPNPKDFVKNADIVVAAVGRADMIRGDWIKPGAVVIDVGINAVDDSTKKSGYRLVGDVCFDEVAPKASKITPVPGGCGPMTIAMLMKNTLNLCRLSIGLERIPLRQRRGDQ
jgi:5,10-methylene-tetrahydrofolate dehydrogenase/methenyl tetrahydrofolate cyclohydrolase